MSHTNFRSQVKEWQNGISKYWSIQWTSSFESWELCFPPAYVGQRSLLELIDRRTHTWFTKIQYISPAFQLDTCLYHLFWHSLYSTGSCQEMSSLVSCSTHLVWLISKTRYGLVSRVASNVLRKVILATSNMVFWNLWLAVAQSFEKRASA